MNSLVSVIIPVYNLSDCLEKSLPSILRQTYHDLEILLIDDGSTDESLKIMQSFTEEDTRIRVLHQTNGGVSAARNTGLENAHGEFIAFIDGDDIVAPFYIERLLEAIQENVLSMCLHERIKSYAYTFADEQDPFITISAEECAKRVLSGNFPVCVWGGIFKRGLIDNLRFPVGIRQNEDKYFLYMYLLRNQSGKVAFTNNKMYGYYVREGSATKSAWNGSRDTIKIADAMHIITKQLHPEWQDLSTVNQISVRLGELKSILRSEGSTVQVNEAYREIKAETLSITLPRKAKKSLKVEYICLKLGDPIYRALVFIYYGFMNDQRRFKRNEKVSRQL